MDLQGAQNGSRHRGIGRYSLALAKGIVRNAGQHQVFVLLNGLFPDTIERVQAAFSDILPPDRFLIFSAPGPVAELRPENTWRRITAEVLREHVIDTLSPDVVLVTSMVEGAEDNTVTSLGRLRSTVPTAAMLYDLIPLTDPDRYIGWQPAKLWYHGKIDSLRRADLLLAISQSAAKEAVRLLGIEPSLVKNISSAVDDSFSSSNVSSVALASVAKRFGIVRKYLMHSSAFETRKNFQGLIRAFAALPAAVRADHQLVLVCKLDASGRQELTTLASSVGLTKGDLILTGFVPDDELIALYAGCHLFVFPSFHEGFGLPALEAMSCGAPAIGSNATSVPEVIGRDDALFDPASLESMTALILKALTDAAFYRSLKAHAKVQAAKFSWDKTSLHAIAGLQELVARRLTMSETDGTRDYAAKRSKMLTAIAEVAHHMLPSDRELLDLARHIESNDNAVTRLRASAAFAGSITWRIEGPFDSTYSLALLNRETARALSALGHTAVLHSTEGPGDFVANPEFLRMNPDLAAMHSRVQNYPHNDVDVVSRNLYPPRVEDMSGRLNLLHHYAWEESAFPSAWATSFNDHLAGLTCLSTHVEKVLLDSGVRVPMTTSGCGVDHWERIVATPGYRVEARAFRFLHVSSCFPRKGVDALLDAYGAAFTDSDDVSLIVKTFSNPHNEIHSMLTERRSRASNYPHVLVLEGDLVDADLKALYQQCHALVAPSRAEGFGLPMAEAMLSGLAVITTGWSGQLDFCNAETAWLVDFSFRPAQSHFEQFASVWADPDINALAQALSTVRNTPSTQLRAKADEGRALLLENFKWSDVASRLVTAAQTWSAHESADIEPRIGWVSTWNTKCGVASYSEHLLAGFPQPVTVLAPHQQGKIREDGANCVRCWRSSKDENDFDELVAQIAHLGLDTLVVQFNYGFYNFRQLSQFIGSLVDGGRAVIVMMHATADPGLPPEWNWTLTEIASALERCQRVLVHSIDDLNRMKRLGLVRNVSLFPHGVLEVEASASPMTRLSPPLVASYGYCLPHKGLVELVQATDLLRKAGTPIRLRLVNAEYPDPVSTKMVTQLQTLIRELAVEDLIETHHDYLDDRTSLRLLQEADLLVYAYQQTNESASGAVRYGLASQRPVAVTPVPIFDDLGGAVHRFAGLTPRALANGIYAALQEIENSTESARAIENAAKSWRHAHNYKALSTRLHNICTALSRDAKPISRIFDGSSSQLKTNVGKIEGRSIRSTGVAGYLVYGPSLALRAGRYEIVVRGSYDVPSGSNAYLDVTINAGQQALARIDLDGHSEFCVAKTFVRISRNCRDLEVRVVVDRQAACRISEIEVRPSIGAALAGAPVLMSASHSHAV